MEPVTVGIREFRENLAAYLLESQAPVAITRHGDAIGYYIPVRRKRTEAERAAFAEAATRLSDVLAARGVTEDDLIADFKKWRAARRK
jgi:antitoxin (DNA-binding transcriptional repressor) of toxin-antitoxin stability system